MKKGFFFVFSRKGFFFTFSVFLVFSFLLFFLVFYAGKVQREKFEVTRNFGVQKVGFVAQDIEGGVEKILGTIVDVNRSESEAVLFFFDKIPLVTDKLELVDYNLFVSSVVSLQQNVFVDLNVEGLVDGKTELLFSNGLQYDFFYGNQQEFVQLYKKGTDSGVAEFDVNLVVSGAQFDAGSSQSMPCDAGGVFVRIFFKDGSGNQLNSDCFRLPSVFHVFVFRFQGESGDLVLSYGNIDGNFNALKVQNNLVNQSIDVNLVVRAVVPFSGQEFSWFYDGDLNVVSGNAGVSRKLLLGVS